MMVGQGAAMKGDAKEFPKTPEEQWLKGFGRICLLSTNCLWLLLLLVDRGHLEESAQVIRGSQWN